MEDSIYDIAIYDTDAEIVGFLNAVKAIVTPIEEAKQELYDIYAFEFSVLSDKYAKSVDLNHFIAEESILENTDDDYLKKSDQAFALRSKKVFALQKELEEKRNMASLAYEDGVCKLNDKRLQQIRAIKNTPEMFKNMRYEEILQYAEKKDVNIFEAAHEDNDYWDDEGFAWEESILETMNSPKIEIFNKETEVVDDLELFEKDFIEGLAKIRELQKIIGNDLAGGFDFDSSSFDVTPKKINNGTKNISVSKMLEFSRALKQMDEKFVHIESFISNSRNNIDMAEAALREWKKRAKKANKELAKGDDNPKNDVIEFLKNEALEMIHFIKTVISKEQNKISEVSNIIQTFHLLNYKLKSGIFEETKPFLFNSSHENQLENAELSQELTSILGKLEPSLSKAITS